MFEQFLNKLLKIKKVYVLRAIVLFNILFVFSGFSQNATINKIPDSLLNKSFKEINKLYKKSIDDPIKKNVYSQVLLMIAKSEKNITRTAMAYRKVSFNYENDHPLKLTYLDSSITVCKNTPSKYYPALSYLNIGVVFYVRGDLNKSLDNYLLALEFSEKFNNESYYYMAKHNIGLLKSKIGEDNDALEVYKDCYDYEKSKNKINRGYLLTTLVLADTYRKLKLIDSSSYYNREGIEKSKNGVSSLYNYFVLNEGLNLYNKKRYYQALDSIKKVLPFIEKDDTMPEKEFLINGYIYKGKIYQILNNDKEKLKNLVNAEKYINNTKLVSTETRECYEMLIEHFQKTKNKNKQLDYINKLLNFDSRIAKNYKVLNKKITQKYDTPILLREKESLIKKLKNQDQNKLYGSIVLTALLIIAVILIIFNYSKKLKYKKRYYNLIDDEKPTKNKINKEELKSSDISISEHIIESILKQLQSFEDNKAYLNQNITTSKLAEEFKTNSKYISKVVNHYKKQTFINYINSLRIEYVTERLKIDNKFRNYTLNAIAREIGFNSSESFSKAFHKKNGINPSYFLKNLRNEK